MLTSSILYPGHVPDIQIVWQGTWTSYDGIYEYRASVGKHGKQFLPGHERSMYGGDSEPGFGEPVATFEEAKNNAHERIALDRSIGISNSN